MVALPVPAQTDTTIQYASTGAVDYLQFTGTTLTSSNLQDYGLGTGPSQLHVVASGDFNFDGNPDLVTQNAAGQVDFINLNPDGTLLSTHLLAQTLPHIVGAGFFNAPFVTSGGAPTLVTQLADGSLDFVQVQAPTETLVQTDTLSSTAGHIGQAVGVGESFNSFQMYNNPVPPAGTIDDSVVTQNPDGSISLLGFNGDFPALTWATSSSTQTAGAGPVGDVNPDFSNLFTSNENVPDHTNSGIEGNLFITTAANGQLDAVYTDSGYGGSTTQGIEYATNLLNLSTTGTGSTVVPGSMVASNLFPVTV